MNEFTARVGKLNSRSNARDASTSQQNRAAQAELGSGKKEPTGAQMQRSSLASSQSAGDSTAMEQVCCSAEALFPCKSVAAYLNSILLHWFTDNVHRASSETDHSSSRQPVLSYTQVRGRQSPPSTKRWNSSCHSRVQLLCYCGPSNCHLGCGRTQRLLVQDSGNSEVISLQQFRSLRE